MRLLEKKREYLAECAGARCRISGIASRTLGWLVMPEGFAPGELLASDFSGARRAVDVREWLQLAEADVMFETTPLNAETGQPAIEHLRAALELGAHAITANKGPVVHAYRELTAWAARYGRRFLFESAVMDGVPIFSLFRQAMPAVDILGFRGVLNSTTNVILESMERGMSFARALERAQQLGVAESDSDNDIDGVDAAVKVIALANVLMGARLELGDVDREGIRAITADQLQQARAQGQALKLVCSAKRLSNGDVLAAVRPERLKLSDPLALASGTSSVISFETDVLPQLIITEQDPGLETTAYGLLADFLTAIQPS